MATCMSVIMGTLVSMSSVMVVYLHSFGCDGSGVNKLSGPYGIYVASQYVCVTNVGNHTISALRESM